MCLYLCVGTSVCVCGCMHGWWMFVCAGASSIPANMPVDFVRLCQCCVSMCKDVDMTIIRYKTDCHAGEK